MSRVPRLSLNALTVRDLPFPEAARLAAEAGFTGFGLLRSTVDDLGPDAVRRELDRHGLEATSVCVALGLVDADPDTARELMRRAFAGLDDATRLGVPLVVVVGGAGPDLPVRRARRQAREAVGRLAERAAAIGGRILVEPLHPVAATLSAFCSLREAAEAISGLEACGLVLDTWHVWAEEGLALTIARNAASIPIVHLADWAADPAHPLERELPGEGVADLSWMSRVLRSHEFDGWWEVEVLSERLWAQDQTGLPRRCAAAARRVLAPDPRQAAWIHDGPHQERR